MRNKLTLLNINQIVDYHIKENVNFLFVVNKYLAEYLAEYLEYYGIEDEVIDLNLNIDEYYVSFTFYDKEAELFVENAKCRNGKYKQHDIPEWTDFFIFTDMSEEDVREYLHSENGTWNFCEYIEDDEYNEVEYNEVENDKCNACCECCNETEEKFTDEDIELIKLIEDYTKEVKNGCKCACTLRNVLMDCFLTGRSIGWKDHQNYISEINGM